MSDLCVVCNEDERRATLRTCRNCGAWGHRWDNREAGDILNYFRKLRKGHRRMSQFATVDVDKEAASIIDHNTLQAKQLAKFKDVKDRAKQNIVSIKSAAAKRAKRKAARESGKEQRQQRQRQQA